MSATSFNHNIPAYNTQSASVILPFVFDRFQVKSILDIGCGIGTWLAVAADAGVDDITGVDGSYVNKQLLHISPDHFREHDLSRSFDMGRKFDLAICLEVAEHIDETNADALIDSIVKHADLVLFSAAIPGQTGEGHVNEQWISYWVKKFSERGYSFHDLLRPVFWEHPRVEWWYKQNMFIVARNGYPSLPVTVAPVHQYIHPDLYKRYNNDLKKYTSGKLPVLQAVKTLVKSFFK